MAILKQLPPPINNKNDFPWTAPSEIIPPQYILKNPPKISIITPSFNQGAFIEETIRSVLLQNYPNLEYIIIDGGSTDETTYIIKKYEKWIHYWISETDEGQSDAINKGIEQATGDIFNWLNSDDLLAPNALWEVAFQFVQNNQADVLIGMLHVFRENFLIENIYQIQCFNDVESTMIFGGMSQPSLFFRFETIKLLRGINKRFHYCMDLDLWYRYLLSFGLSHIVVTEKNLAYYRIHNNTKSSSEKKANEEKLVLILTLLDALGVSQKYIAELKPQSPKIEDYYQIWNINASFLNKFKLKAYLLEEILIMPSFDFPLALSLKFWFISLKFSIKGRRQYFFTLPFRFIYWKLKKRYNIFK